MKEVESRLAAGGEQADSNEIVLAKLTALALFLDGNGLSKRRLTKASGKAEEDFVLRSDDLTDLGLKVIEKGFEKWQRQAKTPDDVKPLYKILTMLTKEK